MTETEKSDLFPFASPLLRHIDYGRGDFSDYHSNSPPKSFPPPFAAL